MNDVVLQGRLSEARKYGLPATLIWETWCRIVDAFDGLCAYCAEREAVVLKHFVPARLGGGTTPGNCLPACNSCNGRKGPHGPEAFDEIFGVERMTALRRHLSAFTLGEDVGTSRVGLPRTIGVRVTEQEGKLWDEARRKMGGPLHPLGESVALRYAMELLSRKAGVEWPKDTERAKGRRG